MSQSKIQSAALLARLTTSDLFKLQAYGTAFGVITSLHKQGRLEVSTPQTPLGPDRRKQLGSLTPTLLDWLHSQMAYFAQTGPYQQGARLTAMELASIGAPHTMVCDTAIAALLTERPVHLFVAGADRYAPPFLSDCARSDDSASLD